MYALLDNRLTMVEDYVYKKADLKDKYYIQGELVDAKETK